MARTWIGSWPVYRQLTGPDRLGLGAATTTARSDGLRPRTEAADKTVKSICPYCAVGCGQNVYVQDGKVTQIEGDPDSPVSRGRLCPKGSASLQLTTGDARKYEVLYRRPHGTEWEHLELGTAMDMIADRVIAARDGLRQPGRRDPGQRGKLPDQEVVHGARRYPDREPGPYLTLLHRPRSGD